MILKAKGIFSNLFFDFKRSQPILCDKMLVKSIGRLRYFVNEMVPVDSYFLKHRTGEKTFAALLMEGRPLYHSPLLHFIEYIHASTSKGPIHIQTNEIPSACVHILSKGTVLKVEGTAGPMSYHFLMKPVDESFKSFTLCLNVKNVSTNIRIERALFGFCCSFMYGSPYYMPEISTAFSIKKDILINLDTMEWQGNDLRQYFSVGNTLEINPYLIGELGGTTHWSRSPWIWGINKLTIDRPLVALENGNKDECLVFCWWTERGTVVRQKKSPDDPNADFTEGFACVHSEPLVEDLPPRSERIVEGHLMFIKGNAESAIRTFCELHKPLLFLRPEDPHQED